MSVLDAVATTPGPLRLEIRENGIWVVVLDRPDSKVNLIDEAWLAAMDQVVTRAEREKPRGLVLTSAKPGNFIAGADVSLIASLTTSDEAASKSRAGQALLDRIEDLPFPTVAAIQGSCLGGGLETALAFRHRVVANDERITLGLPEVRLGILPGFGGTWRLPRSTGILAALPLILTGKNLRPKKALALGVVDRLAAPEYLLDVAVRIAAGTETPQRKPRPWAARATDFALGRTPLGRAFLRSRSRKSVLDETHGHYPAPLSIVDRVIDGYGAPRHHAMNAEADAFGRLAVTPVAKNLLFLFEGNEALARHPWTGTTARVDDTSRRGAVIGAGTMGGGIAGALAARGLRVRMKDVGVEALRIGMAGAAGPLNRRVKRRSLTARERDAILANISPATDGRGLGHVDFVIEAVPESIELKARVFRELEELVPETAFLATNTSSLPIERIAEHLREPERLVGIHFFNPVDRMPLVEIIPGARTRDSVVNRAVGLVRRLKKSPLVVADRPGFLVNRVLLPYLNEAAWAVSDGWSVERIDRALMGFGMPMGPLRVLDGVGLDVASKVAGVLEEAFGERARPAPVLERLLAAGALGAKTNRGFWIGTGKDRRPNLADLNTPSAEPPADEAIVTRLLMGMINEAARCLAEGVVQRPEHIDLGTVLGTGFPPFRGGLRRWARTLGEGTVRANLEMLRETYGARFEPAPELAELFRS
jgi:3-hydroxyacyl-CoA dehydrogenase/enoyl-CoA hydratase/3-hydroxybutyryl-CoA epimerase